MRLCPPLQAVYGLEPAADKFLWQEPFLMAAAHDCVTEGYSAAAECHLWLFQVAGLTSHSEANSLCAP